MLDPRRNLAASAVGLLGVGLYVAITMLHPVSEILPARLALLLAGLASALAGAAPSRRVRFLLLVPVVATFVIVGILSMFTIGIPILLVAAISAYALLIEYAREGTA